MPLEQPSPASQGPLKIGQVFIWQYEILQLLGSGGHAFVYRARHRFLGHMVAIKVLHRAKGVSLEMLRRGQAEAQIEFQLKHPGIVSVLDGGIDNDGLLYIVMELLQGRSMRDALIELGKLHVVEVLRLGEKVARAIDVAHRAGVVHRDLKPENLFFTRDNEIKVIDFGIAKIDDAAGWQTQKDMVMGTAYYLSPEQVMAQPVTPRSDIYALGTIMLEALLGQPPVLRQVEGRHLTFKLLTRIIVTEQLPPLNQIDAGIPAYVDRLLARATAKRADERFASMQDFAEACQVCLHALEADTVQRPESIHPRELWRKTPSSSGVEPIGTPSAPPDHDTAPASRPPFFGGLSSSTVTNAAPSTPSAARSKGEARSTPTVYRAPPEPRDTTAPLGSPRSRPAPVVAAPSSAPAPAALTSPPAPSTEPPATAQPRVVQPAVTEEPPSHVEHEDSPFRPFVVLLWGLAVGILVFGAAAFFILRPKPLAQPLTALPATMSSPAPLAAAPAPETISAAPAPAQVVAPEQAVTSQHAVSPAASTPTSRQATPQQKAVPQARPPSSRKEQPSAAERKSSIF
jgi:serine/threonine-protein kinase